MFVSANYLAVQYGVDDTIAKFFVDRKPPANNLYWKDKLLYLRPEPGWLFIPLIVDLLYKLGLSKQDLLSEQFVGLMEEVGNVSAREEAKLISPDEALEELHKLVKGKVNNQPFYNVLSAYMSGEKDNVITEAATPFKSLHRGDAFLFSLCSLSFEETLIKSIAEQWFALISTLLLLDDAEDIESDQAAGEPNAVLEAGFSKEGLEKIQSLVKENLQLISSLNKPMALRLDKSFKSLLAIPQIHNILNS